MIAWKWSVLSDGWTQAREAILMRGGSWRKVVRCAATAVLLERPDHGPVLFDCGYSSRFFSATERWPLRLHRLLTPVTISEPEGIAAMLRRRGLEPSSIEHVVVSHWHSDHIGGLRDFPWARIHASREGWEAVRGLRGWAALRAGFLPDLLPEDVAERLVWVKEGGDVLGDGSLRVLAFPGHAVGQIGLRFLGTDGRPVLLAADACWLSDAYRLNRPPHPVTSLFQDEKAYGQSLARLHALHRAEPDLLVLPTHCPETAARIAD